ncbi:hypothetical protein Smp_188320 [Schistosoma mansoni]|uniref:hypothetical protein n=1 Tax=Schistosoma mansoni TaxID=6183 RepID=UPI00022C823D|nr:hypothetical protein Smp_188320 [Schistosoma mansoni]|eukprot:XP_018644844.1 hypothetical protein Smp_188320 [Schistosoma mansoni]
MAPLPVTNNVIVSDTTIRPSELYVKNSKEYDKFDENEMKVLNWQTLLPRSSSDQLENRTYPMHIQTVFRIDGKYIVVFSSLKNNYLRVL